MTLSVGVMDLQASHDHAVAVLDGRVSGIDRSAALALFEANAQRGHVGSMVFLGILLKDGTVGPRDVEAGVAWIRRAADAGHVEGEFLLGMCLATAEGVPLDLEQALHWLRRAADRGHEEANFILHELRKRNAKDRIDSTG